MAGNGWQVLEMTEMAELAGNAWKMLEMTGNIWYGWEMLEMAEN